MPGARGGFRLARPADKITLMDVVTAIEGLEHAFRGTEIRRHGAGATGPARFFEGAVRGDHVGSICRSIDDDRHSAIHSADSRTTHHVKGTPCRRHLTCPRTTFRRP
ncbi:MAG TPA: Rrf2 family transcriptional regulator [Pseudonocardia sp.]|nr:Rrf2 family transcriptional regulator [Pseudonocardia sp.]